MNVFRCREIVGVMTVQGSCTESGESSRGLLRKGGGVAHIGLGRPRRLRHSMERGCAFVGSFWEMTLPRQGWARGNQ